MAQPRRSNRNVGKKINYDADLTSLFPDGPPTNRLEQTFHDLNMEAFPHSSYALVDNILVHAQFAAKRRPQGSRAFHPETVGDSEYLNNKDSLAIRDIISKIDCEYPTKTQCETAAMDIQCHLPRLLLEEHLPIIQQ